MGLIVYAAGTLLACGQKGPLMLPDAAKRKHTIPTLPARSPKGTDKSPAPAEGGPATTPTAPASPAPIPNSTAPQP